MADTKQPEDSLAEEVNASDENTLVWSLFVRLAIELC
jgi:hypothetical protein